MRPNASRISSGILLALALALMAGSGNVAGAAESKPERVRVAVDGAGWLRDRELRLALSRLLDTDSATTLSTNAVEDAAVILTSALGEEGFQAPTINIDLVLEDGSRQEFVFDPTFTRTLPRPLRAREVKFRLERGIRSHVEQVEFVGLTAIEEEKARGYFRTGATLLATDKANAFSPGRMSRGADGLLSELRQMGFAESDVKATKAAEAPDGAVTLRVEVREGPKWVIDAVRFQRDEEDGPKLPEPGTWAAKAWTPTLQEDVREAVRQVYYQKGYPDVGVHVDAELLREEAGEKHMEVVATIVPGEHVTVGEVRFEGNSVTRASVLRRRVRLAKGDELNPVALERGRYRISRLGVFEAVDLRYEPTDGPVRDAIYSVREAPRYETHLLMGYGSYEGARVGVEHRQRNIFGFAHQSRLELVQSMKSTSGDYRYTVPELFGESLDGTARLFGLQREEVAFLRQEFGVDITVKRRIWQIDADASLGYTFEALRNRDNELSTRETDNRQINVASVTFALVGDQRDNPLRPRRGYRWATQLEAASPVFGSQATYQRFENAASYHTSWGEGRWVHVGLSQGVITTFGDDDRLLPVNRRFFPGGDNSIRGYQRGEAAPRSADGLFIGGKGFLLLNLEVEQAVTPAWSAVIFADALGNSVTLRDLPFDEQLYSVGLGVRYNTLIGPIRLEYGRNLNPRRGDPSGTWHLSIGYPF
jgi:outer membrane protein assembly complex protein YaeT